VILTQQSRYTDALAPLLTAQQLGKQQDRGERWNNVIVLNLGRAYFAAGNFPKAIQNYAQVERTSYYWPEAQFERAWAHFRLQDMTGTIALLMNHDSPFFTDWYFAEADLLRIYAMFMLCKFPQAGEEVDGFIAKFTPMSDELERSAAGMSAQTAWDQGVRYAKTGESDLPAAVIRKFGDDDRFSDAIASVEKAEDELKRLSNASANPFASEARTRLEDRRAELIELEGKRVLDHVQRRRAELKDMLSNVQVTKLDIMQFETRLYEQAAVTGELEFGDRIGKLRKLRKQKSIRVWPFQGEYWADELGYFRVDTRPDCPEDMRVGGS
jgi:tetratricopeptide (TPR) repeat protein